jgi:phosphate transport system substrate-binding protein
MKVMSHAMTSRMQIPRQWGWKASLLLLAGAVAAAPAAAQDESAAELPHYVAHPVPSPPKDSPYLLPDGSVYVLANDLVGPYFEALDELFTRTHPNIKIHLNPLGSEPAIAALTSGVSAFAPLGRDGIRQDLDGFQALHGYAPQSFLVGYDQSPDPDIFPPGKFPSAVWINAKNPLPKITVALAARIFTTGAPGGDITHWSQLGDKGEWAKREIHVYLPAKRDSAFLFIDGQRFGGRPWSPRVEWVDASTDVMTAVAEDPYGIGIIGFWPPDPGWDRQSDLGAQTKLLPMAENEDAHYSHAGVGDVYPLTGSIRIYFNAAPGTPLEPWMHEYMRLVLSKEGQDLLKSLAAENGYIPLEPAKAAEELKKLK